MPTVIGPVVGSTPMPVIPVVMTIMRTPVMVVAGICQTVGQKPHGRRPHHRRRRINDLLRITISIIGCRAARSDAAKQASQDKSAKSRVHGYFDGSRLDSIQKILT